LFTLPAKVFYVTILLGLYLFLPGILIVMSMVTERTARSWAKYLVALWFIRH